MRFGLRGKTYEINRSDIVDAARNVKPKPFDGRHRYYVELHGLKYPIKQTIHLATRLPNIEFHAGDAKRILEKLGFTVEPLSVTNDGEPVSDINTTTHTVAGTAKFAVTLRPGEDGFIVASVPALPGCHSQGRNEEEAISNIREAIRGYIASMHWHGEEIPSITEVREVEVAV